MEAANVKELSFFRWLDLWNKQGYDGVRVAHRFVIGESRRGIWTINSLKRYVVVAHDMWRFEKPDDWKRFFKFCKDDVKVIEMRRLLHDLKSQWTKRPKPKKSGGE